MAGTVVDAVLERIAREEGVVYFDPTPIFCKQGEATCRRMINNKLVYRDDDHLTKYGAKLLARGVMKAIQRKKNRTKKPRVD